jgi:hypothetical protein
MIGICTGEVSHLDRVAPDDDGDGIEHVLHNRVKRSSIML